MGNIVSMHKSFHTQCRCTSEITFQCLENNRNLSLYILYLADATLLSKVEKATRIFEIFAKENPLIAAMLQPRAYYPK